jgi:oligosaccharide repeat unit polymerase
MKLMPNVTRPDVIFCLVWLLVLAIYLPIPTLVTPPIAAELGFVLAFNILSAPLIYTVIRKRVENRLGPKPDLNDIHLDAATLVGIRRFLRVCIFVWIIIFILNIVASGGLPIIWYLTGDSREYLDYGIRTIGGLGDMFRCFGGVLCIVLYFATGRRAYLWLWLAHFVPSILVMSRGNIAIFILQSVAAYLLMRRLNLRQIVLGSGGLAAAASLFIIVGQLRGIQMNADDYAGVSNYLGGLPMGVYWVWVYVASPLGNVAYAVSLHLQHNYVPQYTLVYLLPSFMRQAVFSGQVYTPLTTEELNATSIYSPLYMDFGAVGAMLGITLLIVLASYVHVMARRGSLFYLTLYPSLYAALGLSFFHIFALTPGVLAVPFLCSWFRRYVTKNQRAKDHSPSQAVPA